MWDVDTSELDVQKFPGGTLRTVLTIRCESSLRALAHLIEMARRTERPE